MEQTSFALESIKDTAQTVQAMKAAGSELKTAFKKQDLDINSIEKLQDEMADLMVGWRLVSGIAEVVALHSTSVMTMHACQQADNPDIILARRMIIIRDPAGHAQ